MLQKLEFDEDFQGTEGDRGYLLKPRFYWELFKRRWPYFVFPFFVISAVGVAGAYLWPATYSSEGRILVQSQQIPSDLVRSTVTSAAQERIQVIQQRTMTRDNLIAIADKFQLFPDKRALMSATELVEQMKKNTKFAPVDLALDFKQRSLNPTIIFSVGFEYSDPVVASRVANELMTRILNEDLRDRTSRATDTTKFLSREVQRLQAENTALDNRIAQVKTAQGKGSSKSDQPSLLDQLRIELTQKSALYADQHPSIQSLKRQIEALEKAAPATATAAAADPNAAASLEALATQQEALQKNLEAASAKLAAARLGENLERDQQSEKLEVIEQPTVPQEPIKPKRPKIAGLALLAAFAAGAGLTLLMELSDKAIRRSSDLFSLVDSKLIIPIPYIVTETELRRGRRRLIVSVCVFIALVVCAGVGAYQFLPPLDLIVAKARVGLFR